MEIIFVLMVISMLMAGCGLLAFLWANAHGQFEDLDSPAQSILVEDTKRKD